MLGSYLLIDKTMELVISKIKYHILLYGKCKILECNNGTEFKNRELKVFTENEGIELIFSICSLATKKRSYRINT